MMEIMLPSLAIIAVILLTMYVARRESPFHFFVAVSLANAVIGLFFPIFSQFIDVITWRNLSGLSSGGIASVQWDYFFYGVGLLSAYLFIKRLGRRNKERIVPFPILRGAKISRGVATISRDSFISIGLIFIGLALYMVYFNSVDISVLTNKGDYAEKYLVSTGAGPLYFGLNLVIAGCLWAESGVVWLYGKWLARLLAVLVIIWAGVFVSMRIYLAILVVGYLRVWFLKRGWLLGSIKVRFLFLLGALFILLEAIMLLRGLLAVGNVTADINNMANKIGVSASYLVGGSEFSQPFITAFELRRDESPAVLLGKSYVESLLTLAPRSLFSSRPDTMAEWFVGEYYPELAARGGGTAFSMVGEAWLNFGPLLGPLIIGASFGLLICFAERYIAVRPGSALVHLSPYLLMLAFLSERTAWGATMKHVLLISLPVIGLLIFYSFLRELLSRCRDIDGERSLGAGKITH